MTNLFFGYESDSATTREAMKSVSERMPAALSEVTGSISWEDLRIDGQMLVGEIENAIDQADVAIFEISTLNRNVLFEVGYAIGRGKRVLLCVDSQDSEATKRLSNFGLLRTTGYTMYRNSDELASRLTAALTDNGAPLLNSLLQGLSDPVDDSRLIYFPSMKQDDPSVAVSRALEKYAKLDAVTLDMDDYGSNPLAWFVQQLYGARWALFHLTPSRVSLADIMNPRVSLLAGLSRGLGRGILLIHEAGEPVALDYADLAYGYKHAREASAGVARWLDAIPAASGTAPDRLTTLISAELSSLRFGNHVAESDQAGLNTYFVETRDYRNVVESASLIFAGRKGTGKTANMLQAADELRRDARNLVCVIKPGGYEFEGLLIVLRRIDSRYLNDYLIEGLWRYLLYTEVASEMVRQAQSKPAGVREGSEMEQLEKLLDEDHGGADATFSLRLERLVDSLDPFMKASPPTESDLEKSRNKINAALFGGTLKRLRSRMAAAAHHDRIRVLVDNLDKGWEKGADLGLLARVLLGLLSTVGRVSDEFRHEMKGKQDLELTLTVFIRSDIFAYVRSVAREPDKMSVSEVEWRDQNLLARVIEDRFVFSSDGKANPSELWTKYFAPTVNGVSTRDYLLGTVQPRPRDIVFFANEVVDRAANAQHTKVEESDILAAEISYSQFAYEALLVEGVASSMDLEPFLIELSGEPAVIEGELLHELMASVGDVDADQVVRLLRQLGFLGIETTGGHFDFGGTSSEMARADVLSKKHMRGTRSPRRFQIHSAYRAYLAISST